MKVSERLSWRIGELLERASDALYDFAHRRHAAALAKKPVAEKLIYAAYQRCPCGAGLAYVEGSGPFGYWDCSAILLGTADDAVEHTAQLPFNFYEVKSEQQPSARGATTRPAA